MNKTVIILSILVVIAAGVSYVYVNGPHPLHRPTLRQQ